jgi:phosphomannomutase
MNDSIRSRLTYEPVSLKFGTSGRRGAVIHLTQMEIYINALAEIEYFQSLPVSAGGVKRGDEFFYAFDLRPSSTQFVAEEGGRGELAQAVERAIRDAGMRPINLGAIPTPALTYYALHRGRGSIMVTGSHIPFHLNGYKTNSAKGELRKADEEPINYLVQQVRERIYNQPIAQSPFNERGELKSGHSQLSPVTFDARTSYLQRYRDYFASGSLQGKRLLVYEHSAVGRDILMDLLQTFGAEAIPVGRSETFVPIDTENIDAAQLRLIENLTNQAWTEHGPIDAVVSTDGDSDRPLILGVDRVPTASHETPHCAVRFFSGDLIGMIVAEALGADAVVVPITCNDAIDRGALKNLIEPKTCIGSPYVIAGMATAKEKGRKAVCGWEPNGGFLLGSDIVQEGRTLSALPTRDAMLPILQVLFLAARQKLTVSRLFNQLPPRFSRSALQKSFPRSAGLRLVEMFSLPFPAVTEVQFKSCGVEYYDAAGKEVVQQTAEPALRVVAELKKSFTQEMGFGGITRLNYLDGVRVYFDNGDIAHFRPSGNADELRIYAVADTQARADYIAAAGISEDGILCRLASSVQPLS